MPLNRRHFLQAGAGLALSSAAHGHRFIPRRPGPNDEIRVAVIGFRGRGKAHIEGLRRIPGVRIVALCDVDRRVLGSVVDQMDQRGERVDAHVDVRQILDRDDVDAVSIATPNHWHALMTVWACQAGKDVYVEKPVSHGIWEGRQMVRAAEKYGRIVQTGTQSRSSPALSEALGWVRAGNLGAMQSVHGLCYKPRPSIGKVTEDQKVDAALDYDLWTGPAPLVPLRRKQLHYDWHWDFATGNGDLGNQGVHQMDIARWAIGEQRLAPRVLSMGGRFGYDDDGNTPNTQLVWHDYDVPILFEVRGLPRDASARVDGWSGSDMDEHNGLRIGVTVRCEGGELRIPSYTKASAYDAEGRHVLTWDGGGAHFVDFIDAMRSRRSEDLSAPILDGHLSSALCHMANASYLRGQHASADEARVQIGERAILAEAFERMQAHLAANEVDHQAQPLTLGPWLEMDPASERFTNDDDANALLKRDYRTGFVVPEDL